MSNSNKSYFTDDQGAPSSMRLMSILALLVAAGLACVEAFGWGTGESKTELVLYFLVAAFAPKAVQKSPRNDRLRNSRLWVKQTKTRCAARTCKCMFELTAEPNLSMAAAARRTEGRGAAAPEAHQEGRDYFDMRTVHGE